MRTLKFIVDGDQVTRDPNCSFDGLFPARNQQIQAEFSFSPEWKSRAKVAAFWSILDKEYEPRILNDENVCQIPEKALANPTFKVQILGKQRGRTFQTNKFTVYQRGGIR